MRPAARAPALLAALALLAACEPARRGADTPEPAATVAPETPGDAAETAAGAPPEGAPPPPDPDAPTLAGAASPQPPEAEAPATPARPAVPHIYLALQPGGTGRPTSAIFAIDAARDGTPSDDPAIRLTPEAGRCNPQEMRRYAFPEGTAPVVGEAEGLSARDLPRFLAAAVTGRLIEAGLAAAPEDTRPLNICTRKLWERLIVAENRDRIAGGQ